MSNKADITIIGAGVIGLAIASQVARGGKQVYILEKNETRVVGTAKVNSLTYELIMFKINEEIGERPYLKMINPSVGIYHVEGVPPSVTTVAEALDSRNKTSVRPTILS